MTNYIVSRRLCVKTATAASLGIALAACRPIPPVDDAEPAMGQVTAAQVTDPESLKAFVLAAKAHIEATTHLNEGAKLREKLKTEDKWKSGSTFLIVLFKNGNVFGHGNDRDAESKNLLGVEDERGTRVVAQLFAAAAQGGVTLFHGSEPFREGQPTDLTRTDSQGVRFAEELIGGARREGRRFLRYHYDNPAIEGDEETGSPKLGYAVSFPVPNSDQKIVVGSGIYIDPDDE